MIRWFFRRRRWSLARDQQGNYCAEHSPKGYTCFCDEERDRKAGIHRCSSWSDAFGGYMCICDRGSFSTKYGCMAGDEEDDVLNRC